jgi:hypothetical protein
MGIRPEGISMTSISTGTSLSISVSGTAYLQKCVAAGALPGSPNAPTRVDDPTTVSGKKPSGADALGKASEATRDAIEAAIKKFDPNGSIRNYKDGQFFQNAFGGTIDIIA